MTHNNSDSLTSVIELSEQYNISKQAVFKHIKSLDIDIIKVKNKAYLNAEDVNKITKKLQETNVVNVVNEVNETVDKVNEVNEKVVKHSQNEVDEVDKKEITADAHTQNVLLGLQNDKEEVERLKRELELRVNEVNEYKTKYEVKNAELNIIKDTLKEMSNTKQEYYQLMQEKDKQISKLNSTLDEQQKLLYNQQSLALQSNDKIKQLEEKLEKSTISEDAKIEGKNNEYQRENNTNASNNKVDNFYNDLRNERQEENRGFFSKLFGKK